MPRPPLEVKLIGGKAAIEWMKGHVPTRKTRVEVLKSIRVLMNRVIGIHFGRAARGGRFRGVTWAPFKFQYRRKIDNAIVRAEGGTPRIRPPWAPAGQSRGKTRGSVLGKKRPSGRRITRASNLMQDTGRLRATRAQLNSVSPKQIRFGPTVQYGVRQNKLRPFAFYEVPKDVDEAQRVAFRTFNKLMMRQ